MGLRPSIFMDVGALWGVNYPSLVTKSDNQLVQTCTEATETEAATCFNTTTPGYIEQAYGNSASPRISVGVGVSWNSPFGPFRFDLAKAIKKVEGDETQIFQFNVGTQF